MLLPVFRVRSRACHYNFDFAFIIIIAVPVRSNSNNGIIKSNADAAAHTHNHCFAIHCFNVLRNVQSGQQQPFLICLLHQPMLQHVTIFLFSFLLQQHHHHQLVLQFLRRLWLSHLHPVQCVQVCFHNKWEQLPIFDTALNIVNVDIVTKYSRCVDVCCFDGGAGKTNEGSIGDGIA